MKIKSDAQVAMNKYSDPAQNFPQGGWGGQCPNSNFSKLLKLYKMSRTRKLIFGLQVNIDKAYSRRYDVTRYMVHKGPGSK